MELHRVIRERFSLRKYQDTPVPRDVIRDLVDTARFAPSAKNGQEWRALAVTDPATRAALGEAAGQTFVGSAPVVFAICGDSSVGTMACGVERHLVDVAIFIDHLTLAATAAGLGSCWIGHFDQDKVRSILGVPDPWEVVELLPVGYPPADVTIPTKTRKDLADVLTWEFWDGTKG